MTKSSALEAPGPTDSTDHRRSIPFQEWPVADQAAWLDAFRDEGILGDRGPAAHWSRGSRQSIQYGYASWLAFLDQHGLLTPAVPEDRVTKATVVDYAQALKARVSDTTLHSQLHHLYSAIRVMAPEGDWAWLKEMVAHFRRQIVIQTDKNCPPVDSARLYELGVRLMRQAETSEERQLPRSILYRDGLIIALLAARPVRRRTLASIEIGRQLKQVGHQWWLIFGPEDVKNKRPLEFQVPDDLVPYLETYLNEYRIAFPAVGHSNHLWLSSQDRPLTPGAIYQRVGHHTKEAFGESVPLHHFRHSAATSIARRDPEHVLEIAPILGHAHIDMAYRHYIRADMREAGKEHQAAVLNLRQSLAKKPRHAERSSR
jgi:integrase